MQAIDDLLSELDEAIASAKDYATKADYRLAKKHMVKFKEEFNQRHLSQQEKISRASRQTIMNVPADYDYVLPELFSRGEPVKKLFLYGIPFKSTKKKIYDILRDCEQSDFWVDKLFYKNGSTCGRLTCSNFASAVKLQCDSIMNKVFYHKRETAISEKAKGWVRCKPFILEISEDAKKIKTTNSEEELSDTVVSLRFPIAVLQNIAGYLNSNDKMNLMTALEGQRGVGCMLGCLDFDTRHERYRAVNGIIRMFEDAQQFKFKSMTFAETEVPVHLSVVNKILGFQEVVKESLYADAKMQLTSVDLRGVSVSTKTFDLLSKNFSVLEIKIRKTTGFFETHFKIEGIKSLSFHDNPTVRLKCLSNRTCKDLTILKINNCKMIQLEYLLDLLTNNSTLKELYVSDCLNIDKNIHIRRLLEGVFNSNNRLKVFHFNYEKSEVEKHNSPYDPPVLGDNNFLEEINLDGNIFIEKSIPEILRKAPALRSISFLRTKQADVLDFSGLSLIDSIKMTYHQQIEESLNSLSNTRVSDVLIVNALKKNDEANKTFKPNFIKSVIRNVDKFRFVAKGCKIELAFDVRRFIRAIGATIEDKHDELLCTL